MFVPTTLVLLLAVSTGMCANPAEVITEHVLETLRGLDSEVRPSVGVEPTEVDVQTYIRNMDVDDVNMKVKLDITFRMIWNDPRVTFDSDKGVQNVIVLTPHLAWLPDAFFKNAFTTQYKSVHPENYLRVHPDGKMIYSTRLSVELGCHMDLSRFPHDTQECAMMIASYGYTANDMILKWREDTPTEIGQNLHGGRFSLHNFVTSSCDSRTSTGEYSCVRVAMKIKRDFGTYLVEWYLPTIFLIVVAWFSFFIPAEQFLGRLLLALVPLISLSSFSHTFTQGMASVPYIRAYDIFTGFSLATMFLTLVHIVVCYIQGVKSNYVVAEGKSDDAEEGGKTVEVEELSGFKKLLAKAKGKVEFLSRNLIVGFYIAFLFVYFVAYCGTG